VKQHEAKGLALVHDSPLGGHSGYLKTYIEAKRDWYWQGMKSDVKAYIRAVTLVKGSNMRQASLLVATTSLYSSKTLALN
jgi:hypothetical protein